MKNPIELNLISDFLEFKIHIKNLGVRVRRFGIPTDRKIPSHKHDLENYSHKHYVANFQLKTGTLKRLPGVEINRYGCWSALNFWLALY